MIFFKLKFSFLKVKRLCRCCNIKYLRFFFVEVRWLLSIFFTFLSVWPFVLPKWRWQERWGKNGLKKMNNCEAREYWWRSNEDLVRDEKHSRFLPHHSNLLTVHLLRKYLILWKSFDCLHDYTWNCWKKSVNKKLKLFYKTKHKDKSLLSYGSLAQVDRVKVCWWQNPGGTLQGWGISTSGCKQTEVIQGERFQKIAVELSV